MPNIFNLFKKVFGRPASIPADTFKQITPDLTKEQLEDVKRFGVSYAELSELMHQQTLINFDRFNLSREIDRALLHPIMAGAVEIYADTATIYDIDKGATIWIESKNKKYELELNKLLKLINIEERIFDWAWTTAAYGDLFIKVEGVPGLGIVSVDDNEHPINISRIDYKGRLIGFYRTPYAQVGGADVVDLMPPWEYVHFRLLGAKKRRPIYNSPMFTEYSTTSIMSQDIRQVSSKYGTSVLNNALPIYKRLRLSEDAIMLARLSKGLLRYIYKVKVDGTNYDAVSVLIDEYKSLLKRARALDITQGDEFWTQKYNVLGINEDVIVPVFGDVNDLQVEKLGGEADIRWIKDVEELRNQLASALRVPLPLLGAYTGEIPESLSGRSLERYDIRFARQVRRLQRAIIEGVKRLCQIHLAYLGLDPDPDLFEVMMSVTSTAEEEELKEALDKGADVVEKIMRVLKDNLGEDFDAEEALEILFTKVLRFKNFDIKDLKKGNVKAMVDSKKQEISEYLRRPMIIENADFYALLPKDRTSDGKATNALWEQKYKDLKVKVERIVEG